MTLDLKNPEGKAVFLELVKKADIVLENYRPGVMERLGLGYEELKKVNPGIIYGCLSGFGHYGPYSSRPGYDIIAQAMGGLMSTTGWPGGEPTRSGTAIGDVMGGISLCVGVEAAYIHKLHTGEGQKVDVALVDSVVSALEIITQIYLSSGRVPQRIGNRYEASYPYDSFHCKDGDIVIGAGNNKLYSIMCDVMGRPDLKEDERFLTNPDRIDHHEVLKEIIEEWTTKNSSDEIVNSLLEAGCPAAPIYSIDQVTKDPHIADAREMFVEMEHPVAGKIRVTGNQIKMSKTPVSFDRPAPVLGQHTKELLTETLGISDEEFERLKEAHIF